MEVGRIEQLIDSAEYGPLHLKCDELIRAEHEVTKARVLITSILMEDKEKYSRMWDKAGEILKIVDGLYKKGSDCGEDNE